MSAALAHVVNSYHPLMHEPPQVWAVKGVSPAATAQSLPRPASANHQPETKCIRSYSFPESMQPPLLGSQESNLSLSRTSSKGGSQTKRVGNPGSLKRGRRSSAKVTPVNDASHERSTGSSAVLDSIKDDEKDVTGGEMYAAKRQMAGVVNADRIVGVKSNAVPPEPYRIVGPSMSHGSKEALEQHDSVPRLTRRTVSTAPGRAESQASASAGSLAFSSHAIADGDVRQRIERASSDAVEALIKELHGMDVVELLRRLKDTEENVTNGIKGGKKRDLSVKPDVKFTKKRKGAGVPAEVISEKEERASPFKRLVLKVKHWKESFQEHFSKSKKDGFAEPIGLQIPPPPEDVDPHDYLLLAIHYHETDNLQLSVYYLEKSAKEGNPVGLHLLGMCLRHGWGIEADIVRAVKCFVRSTEAALATFIDGWNRMKKPQEDTEKKADLEIGARGLSKHSPTAPASRSGSLERQIRPRSHSHAASIFGRPSQVPQPSIAFLRALSFSNDSHPISQKRSRRQSSSSMASSRSQSAWSISRLVTRSVTLAPDLPSLCEIIHQVLPLPLYELAQTFMHHLRSPPAAFFYLSLAAQAGDVDAVIEVAEAFEHGRGCKRDKRAAAFWYRRAAELGREVFGTGWIWKEKWA